jgi:hypothetical protein
MKKIPHSICLALIIASIFISSPALGQDLSLKIEIDKLEFIEGEPIYVVITLINSFSQSQDYINFLLQGRSLDLHVTGPDGKMVPYSGDNFSFYPPIKYLSLPPNSIIQYVCPLTFYYHNFIEQGTSFPFPIVARLAPGKYTFSANYTIKEKVITSNILTFTVAAPHGEDAGLFEILKTKFRNEFIMGGKPEEKEATFKNLAIKYNKSKYYPLVCQYIASFLFEKGDTLGANEINKTLIKANPNTGHAIQLFKWLKLSDREKIDFYHELKLSSPNSRVVRYVENRQTQ